MSPGWSSCSERREQHGCSAALRASQPWVSSAVFVPHRARLTCDIPPLWHTTSFLSPTVSVCWVQTGSAIFYLESQPCTPCTRYKNALHSATRVITANTDQNCSQIVPYFICPSSPTAQTFRTQAFVSKIITDYCPKVQTPVPVTVAVKPITSLLLTQAESLLRNLSKIKQTPCTISGKSSPSRWQPQSLTALDTTAVQQLPVRNISTIIPVCPHSPEPRSHLV